MDVSLPDVRVLATINGLELFGHERGNIEVLKVLRKLGASVMVGINAREGGGAVGRELASLGFDTFLLPFNPQWSLQFVRKHPSMIVKNPWALVRCSAIFRRVIHRFKPTHIHLGSALAYSYVSAALATSRTPMVYRMGDKPPVDSRFNFVIWKMAMRRAAAVVAISDFIRRSAIDSGVDARRIQTIYNVAPSREEAADSAVEIRRSPRVLYVGAVSEEKGLMPLVEAFATILRDMPAVHLDIVGASRWDTEFRERLASRIEALQISDRVAFHGHRDDPSPFYRGSLIHVAPSLCDEALGNVVLEAKREGTPSIVFASGGLPETIRHQIDGYVCEDRSAESLAGALRWMLGDDERRLAMGAAARRDYELRFAEERFAREWAAVYRAVAPVGSGTIRQEDPPCQ
jgi:glycosyltransferase involved in cell wall biosynthesis